MRKGAQTGDRSITVSREAVQSFAKGILEDDPLYHDIHTALERGYRDLPLPMTMPVTFWTSFHLPWLDEVEGPLIHGKQGFTYHRTLVANQPYTATITLEHVYEKKGSKGVMLVMEHRLNVFEGETLCAEMDTTLLSFKGESR